MKLPLILTVALSTASYLHFMPSGQQITREIIKQANQIPWDLSSLITSQSRPSGTHQAGDFKACPTFFFNETPPQINNVAEWQPRALCFSSFAVYHSGLSRTPLFVAERINKKQMLDAKGEQRTNRFYAEARLPFAERASLDDYKGSGYDRGHLAPAGNMPTPEAMAQSFSLANMVPQAPENNRGVWAKSVEKAVRKYAMRANGDVYVITGVHFSGGKTADSKMQRVWVPSALYKLVYDPTTGKSWAYWVDNHDAAKLKGVISYQNLVARTGIEFIPTLSN